MYAIYQQVCEEGKLKLKLFEKDISLAGFKVGIIPNLLKSKLTQSDNEPHPWHLPILDIYKSQAKSVIIDIKPKNRKEDSILICELTDVFGYSDRLWTPILFRLNTLFVDLPSGEIDKLCFEYPNDPGFI
ncbi:MAG: hypothetical protein WCE90_01395 [Candidatus Zixiibacteriota bacterium]